MLASAAPLLNGLWRAPVLANLLQRAPGEVSVGGGAAHPRRKRGVVKRAAIKAPRREHRRVPEIQKRRQQQRGGGGAAEGGGQRRDPAGVEAVLVRACAEACTSTGMLPP